MSPPFLSAAAAAVLSLGATFPAAAQQITVQQSTHAKGAGLSLKAMDGKEFRGSMTVNCDNPYVSFYKAGAPTAITVSDGIAKAKTVESAGPTVEADVLSAIPEGLDPAKLCVAGRPDASAARAAFLARLTKD